MTERDYEVVNRVLGIPFPPDLTEEEMQIPVWEYYNILKMNPEALEQMQKCAYYTFEELRKGAEAFQEERDAANQVG